MANPPCISICIEMLLPRRSYMGRYYFFRPITRPSHPMNCYSTRTHYCRKLDQQLC